MRKEHTYNCDDNVITQLVLTLAIHSSRYEAHDVGKVGETSRSYICFRLRILGNRHKLDISKRLLNADFDEIAKLF